MMGAEVATDANALAGSATTDAAIKGFQVHIQLQDFRDEYQDDMKRAAEKLWAAFQADPDLYRAFSYLAMDSPFAVIIAPNEKKRIITLGK
jgi:hypothetical protein